MRTEGFNIWDIWLIIEIWQIEELLIKHLLLWFGNPFELSAIEHAAAGLGWNGCPFGSLCFELHGWWRTGFGLSHLVCPIGHGRVTLERLCHGHHCPVLIQLTLELAYDFVLVVQLSLKFINQLISLLEFLNLLSESQLEISKRAHDELIRQILSNSEASQGIHSIQGITQGQTPFHFPFITTTKVSQHQNHTGCLVELQCQ